MAKIGFVGLGHMGLPMAINLVKAGHMVTGFDINANALESFRAAGGKIASELAMIASDQEIIITMLQTGTQIREVYLGEHGLFHQVDKNTLYIDCSSIDVQTSRIIHQKASQLHVLAVDAPVSGGVAGASQATLTFMVGGSEDAFLKAEKLLAFLGKKIIHTGPGGSGQAAKICNNMILGISMIAISEAFTLAEYLGLTPQKLFEVVTHSSGQCWAMSHYAPVPGLLDNVPANHNYQPGFTGAMMLKDLCLSQQSAQDVGLNTQLGSEATKLYQQFIDKGLGHLDFSAIIKMIPTPSTDSSPG